ncbi:hypothetical protein, partial [Burkholderia pseudomallei]|uniref:hypothetical protein n=1 Tax=Burkholderia pseudomallei TaxID=28450 RepID=UPI001C4BB14A
MESVTQRDSDARRAVAPRFAAMRRRARAAARMPAAGLRRARHADKRAQRRGRRQPARSGRDKGNAVRRGTASSIDKTARLPGHHVHADVVHD